MHSFKIRFIFVFGLFTLISCGILCLISAFSILDAGIAAIEDQGAPVVEAVSNIVDGDEFEAFLRNKSEDNPYYEKTRLAILDIKTTVGCEYLYTMAPKNGNIYEYIIDGSCDPSDEENFSALGDTEDINNLGNAPRLAMETGRVTNSGLVAQDDWGYQISTYKAIKNSSGRVVGFIGCDFNIEKVMDEIYAQIRKMVIISIIAVIIGIALVYLFTKTIFGRMAKVSAAMEDIAAGEADLTARIPDDGNNELSALAKSCNSVIEKLAALIKELQKESSVLSDSGNHLHEQMKEHVSHIKSTSDVIGQITKRVNDQSARIEQLATAVRHVDTEVAGLDEKLSNQSDAIMQSSSAVEEISSNIHSVDRNVNLILDEYEKLVLEATSGRRKQEEVSLQIDQIAQQSQNLHTANAAINSIASKTNLLAMNAAIEAAHAGEAGKGFAVVAGEIRELANISSKQSASIRELLDGITVAIEGIVESSAQSASSFDNVNKKIEQLSRLIKEVQSGMREESSGVDDILQSMKLLDNITREITNASSNMKNDSSKAFKSIQELQQLASSTREETTNVSRTVSEMKNEAEDSSNASSRSREAAVKVADMINGYKA